MKTPFLILIALFWSFTDTIAQNKLTVEPQLGTAISPLKGQSSEGTVFKPSLQFGIGIGYEINEHWSFKTGPFVSNSYALYADTTNVNPLAPLEEVLGNLIDGFSFLGEEYVDGRSSYWNIDVPIAFQYLTESKMFFRFGLYGSYLFANTNKQTVTTHVPILELVQLDQIGLGAFSGVIPQNGSRKETNHSTEGMNSMGWGGLVSVGYEGEHWIFHGGYQYGFSNIRNDDKYVNINHRQVIQLTIGYRFFPDFSSTRMKPKYDLDLIQ